MTAQFFFAHFTGRSPWGKSGTQRKAFIQETTNMFLSLAVIDERETLENDLDGIAEHAYQLATAMARSGAHWLCTMEDSRIGKPHGFRIKSDRMEELELWDNEEVTRLTVDLVAAPMLLKYGGSGGRNFENCRVFSKAQVIRVPDTKLKKGKA